MMLAACGSAGDKNGSTNTTGQGTATVTISLGNKVARSLTGAAGDLANVAALQLSISAADMPTIAQSLPINGGTVTLIVPVGVNRLFSVSALDANSAVTHQGSTLVPQLIAGTSVHISVTLNPLGPDIIPPSVTSATPTSGASDVTVTSTVRIVFSEPIDAATLTGGSVMVSDGTGNIPGSVSYDANTNTAIFAPSSNLVNATTYTVLLTTAITDIAGNPLAISATWTFTTVSAASTDNTAPVFDGVFIATPSSLNSIDIAWNSASDDVTPANSLVYDISVTTSSGAAFSLTQTSAAGALSDTIGNLSENTDYFIVVRARDQAGNRDSNTYEALVHTPATSIDTRGYGLAAIAPFGADLVVKFLFYDNSCGFFLLDFGDGNTKSFDCPADGGSVSWNYQYHRAGTYPFSLTVNGTMVQSGVLTIVPHLSYVKASNTNAGDNFGKKVALSADGNTLVVGAPGEDSNGSSASDNSAIDSGAVYVYTRSANVWVQQAYIKAATVGAGDGFGASVALSADGNTLAVGADLEDSAATGINGNESDKSAVDSGAAYVFTRTGTAWSQQAYVKASNTDAGDNYGVSIALSSDGNTMVVGAWFEDGGASGINGDATSNSTTDAGAAYVYTRTGSTWSQQAYVKASNPGTTDGFGHRVALSADGSTLAVTAVWEDSGSPGINGNQLDESAFNAGAAYVYTRSGSTWSQEAYVKASNPGPEDTFGASVALSADGNTMAIGADLEKSSATGVGGDQLNDNTRFSGAVYVYTRIGTSWSQEAYVKATNTGIDDTFGFSVALSSDGNAMAVGAFRESSAAKGINDTIIGQADNSAADAGAVYTYNRSGSTWTPSDYVKATNTNAGDTFGWSVALSANGVDLAVGANGEDSAAVGINDTSIGQVDNNATDSGAVYLY
jgi:hypothetical protein